MTTSFNFNYTADAKGFKSVLSATAYRKSESHQDVYWWDPKMSSGTRDSGPLKLDQGPGTPKYSSGARGPGLQNI